MCNLIRIHVNSLVILLHLYLRFSYYLKDLIGVYYLPAFSPFTVFISLILFLPYNP